MSIVERYLTTYAEPGARAVGVALAGLERCRWQQALVLPAFDETNDFATSLTQHPGWSGQRILAIIVINQPRELGETTVQNRDLMRWFEQWPVLYRGPQVRLCQRDTQGSGWLVIDACREWAPTRAQGVGLARKLGCDLAVALFQAGLVESPWVASTDADARLPDDYFGCAIPVDAAAMTYRFKHYHPNPANPALAATRRYEQALAYYRKSLAWAGSEFAFTALGSSMRFAIPAYCHVRGFPKRSGGEDFYLLNKLAKLGRIVNASPEVALLARHSHRVPFGTGPTTRAIAAAEIEGKPWTYYHPQCFRELKSWLDIRARLWRNPELPECLPPGTRAALTELGVSSLFKHLQQVSSQTRAATAFRDWFDGFRTLKFIHYLQRYHHPALPLEQCLEQAVYL